MESKSLDQQVSISAEPALSEMAALSEAGVSIVVCNRPEYEAEDLPTFDQLEQAVNDAGMEFIAIPFSRGQMQPGHVDAFVKVLQSGKRIHAFCRSGNRSCNLWAAAHCSVGTDKAALRAAAESAGFDVSGVLVSY
ncbi:TIGR01244 family sulfur transferase [Microbulbifer bruguierae]|uniref:TIGR01244 family sulfur transferase n=1 Tax=Microbulbifer bruguierae TaxID=3029061 RepID=A0ABY8NEJ8_9GAMM|nr:TIGR01244 family sulfur transferase [Microbulbifer bruguierae]WGL17348.1 TIGR01244 family sulfur transferase [Microbulbifer bruguierae]